MKKSKVIIPALAVLVLSTAASVTGTVAWFTASRTATLTAGEFAVVNTNSNLEMSLSSGIGVTPDDAAKTVTQKAKKTLTDSSFDHTVANRVVVAPDTSRSTAEHLWTFAEYSEANFLRSGSNANNEVGVYSAFAWDVTLSVTFPAGAVYDMGIFLDLSKSYVREKVNITAGDTLNSFVAGTYKLNKELTGGDVTIGSTGTAAETQELFKAEPDATGKGFRLAFIPKSTDDHDAGSVKTITGYTKVWAPHQDSENAQYVATSAMTEGDPLPAIGAGSSYGTATTKVENGNNAAIESLGGSKVLIATDTTNGSVPADKTVSHSNALSGNNTYLAHMQLNPGKQSSITFTCLAWYEGTDPNITQSATDFEKVVLALQFAGVELAPENP